MFAPLSVCAPQTLPFSITATGTSPSFSLSSGSSASRSSSRFAQARPAGPPPTIATPTSIRSSSGSVGSAISSRSSNGGGNSARSRLAVTARRQPPFFAFTASVSFGMILCRSPTTPRSQNSKIGAFGSLLIARMFSEFCIPTLCWIAPEIPAAR